jgi:hypothetical protein
MAHYYIGKAAFGFEGLQDPLFPRNTARQLDKDRYYVQATIRIISSYFGLHDRGAVTREVDGSAANAAGTIRPKSWVVGVVITTRGVMPPPRNISACLEDRQSPGQTGFWFYLYDAAPNNEVRRIGNALGKYLQVATDPAGKAKVLLKFARCRSLLINQTTRRRLPSKSWCFNRRDR